MNMGIGHRGQGTGIRGGSGARDRGTGNRDSRSAIVPSVTWMDLKDPGTGLKTA